LTVTRQQMPIKLEIITYSIIPWPFWFFKMSLICNLLIGWIVYNEIFSGKG
jgi:hypothetical protein